MNPDSNEWELLLERIVSGMTTSDDAAMVRDLLDQVAELECYLRTVGEAIDGE